MSGEFGAGIFLDPDIDFEVDESGDIRTITGEREFQKDIAFFVKYELEREIEDEDGNITRHSQIGQRLDATTLKRIEIIAEDTLLNDPRVDSINSLDAREVDENDNRVELVADVDAELGPQELVIEVNV